MGGTGGRRVGHGLGIAPAATAALPPFTAALALELAPVRVNLIAAGFVDTPLSAALLGNRLEERRSELRATLPIGRVVTPADVAALVRTTTRSRTRSSSSAAPSSTRAARRPTGVPRATSTGAPAGSATRCAAGIERSSAISLAAT